MSQVYLKDVILDYPARGRFLKLIRHMCDQNNIPFPFTKKSGREGMVIEPDKAAFDRLYSLILVRFHNSTYRYCGLKNYPLYQHLKSIYESQGWEMSSPN